ncbi:MAG: cupin domain-containing protein [Chloroflexi bacterium]|nr:cupin domain-containing protein [Chloroflexota bacterium]MBV9596217.1 cupin domain-containing protein [Chloroflexota bacterium]
MPVGSNREPRLMPLPPWRTLPIPLLTGIFAAAFVVTSGSGMPALAASHRLVSDDLAAVGFDAQTLAEGKLDAPPTGPTYVSFVDVPQPGGDRITHSHVAGFVYTLSGVARVTLADGSSTDLNPGAASFFIGDNVSHTHENPTAVDNEWLFISLRPASARATPLPIPGASTAYATDDLADLPQGPTTERLMLVTLQPGGHDAPHANGGIETLYVLQGTVRLQLTDQSITVDAGQGFSHPPATPIQAINDGTTRSQMLAHFVTPDDQPFRTDLDHAP